MSKEYRYQSNLARKAGMKLKKVRNRHMIETYGGYYLVGPETRGVIAGTSPAPGMLDFHEVEDICRQEIKDMRLQAHPSYIRLGPNAA
jgi:hypothetical protein